MLFLSGNLCQLSDLEGSSALSYDPLPLCSLSLRYPCCQWAAGRSSSFSLGRNEEISSSGDGAETGSIYFFFLYLGLSPIWQQYAPSICVQVYEMGWKLCICVPNPNTVWFGAFTCCQAWLTFAVLQVCLLIMSSNAAQPWELCLQSRSLLLTQLNIGAAKTDSTWKTELQ